MLGDGKMRCPDCNGSGIDVKEGRRTLTPVDHKEEDCKRYDFHVTKDHGGCVDNYHYNPCQRCGSLGRIPSVEYLLGEILDLLKSVKK